MMRLLSVTWKDLIQSSRTWSAYIFMFVLPILVTFLFMLMFGGVAGDEEGFVLPRTAVVIVNQDTGQFPNDVSLDPELEQELGLSMVSAGNMGDILTKILLSNAFAEVMIASEDSDPISARQSVDNQENGVAIIIPVGFTDSIGGQGGPTTVEIYNDPALTIGPNIVEGIVRQLLDGFSANQISMSIALDQLVEGGLEADPELVQLLLSEFTSGTGTQKSPFSSETSNLIQIQSIASEGESTDLLTQIISVILAGMMVFFAFFTGSATMESILVEEERGTLARLFTTPNSHRTILAGKSLAAIITLIVQVFVLLLFGRFVFNIDWGTTVSVILAALGLIVVSAATGLFLVSFLKNTRQSGIVFGGILTLTGMIGLMPVFTAGVPDQPDALGKVSLLVPQGWAIRGFTTAMEGGTANDTLVIFGVLLLWSLVFAVIGQFRLQRRFA
jgi:ABC-2 type transport system permease protein